MLPPGGRREDSPGQAKRSPGLQCKESSSPVGTKGTVPISGCHPEWPMVLRPTHKNENQGSFSTERSLARHRDPRRANFVRWGESRSSGDLWRRSDSTDGAASTITRPEFEEWLKSSRGGRQDCAAHSSQKSRDEWGTDLPFLGRTDG